MKKRIVTEKQWWDEMVKHGHSDDYIEGGVVFSNDCIKTGGWRPNEYSEDGLWSLESRTYICGSNEKAFGDYCGYSIFASSLEGGFARIERWLGNSMYPVEEYFIVEKD